VAYLYDPLHSDEDRERRLAQLLAGGELRLRRRFAVSGIDVAVLERDRVAARPPLPQP
jgi:hypothetical protein